MREAQVPLFIEDFEVGDRIYNHDVLDYRFGTVIDICNDNLVVRFDDGVVLKPTCPLSDRWGKPLQLHALEPGMTISAIGFSGKRVYAVVILYKRDALVLRYLATNTETTHVPSFLSIENQFKYWEIEG